MEDVLLDNAFEHVAKLARARARGRGFGVKGSAHAVLWPKYDSYRLGVLIGMLYGDGNLIKRATALRTGKWRIEFCEGDLLIVRGYARLTRRLFNVVPTIRDRKTWYEAYYCSRIVYEFLTFAGEHPNGKKTGKLNIPEVARRNPSTLLGLVSGLYSVEGSVKTNHNARLAMEMLEPELIRALCCDLKTLGFHPHMYRYLKDDKMMFGLYVYGFQECRTFLEQIGLLGKRRRKLSRFLKSHGWRSPARKQPGGE